MRRLANLDEIDAGAAASASFYLRPIPAPRADVPDGALVLAGGPLRIAGWQVISRQHEILSAFADTAQLRDWGAATSALGSKIEDIIARCCATPPPFAGFALDGPGFMAIINVTPDSFHDGGLHRQVRAAREHGLRLLEEGAHILDIGGESTRPGAPEISENEEIDRIAPVIEALADCGAPISIDTRKPGVMRAAVAAGATIINDVTALTYAADSAATAAALRCPVILMHSRGSPGDMARRTDYGDVLLDVYDELRQRLDDIAAAGHRVAGKMIDPGIGFAKTAQQSAALLAGLSLFHGAGQPILVGASRKSFIARLSSGEASEDRLPGTIAAHLLALQQGAQWLRVHDMAAGRQAVAIWRAVAGR